MDGADLSFAIGLEPKDAVAHLGAKEAAVTGAWTEWLNGEHARAFTVANVAKLDVVTDIQQSLTKALKEGQTFEQWKKNIVPTLQAKGWWQRDATTEQLTKAGRIDSKTGEIAKGLTPARLSTIFATNMQSAYMAGRYNQMMAQVDDRPYWEYVAVMDARTRPMHAAMHGQTFRYDDPGWKTFFPPCGYRCRCRAVGYSEREVSRRGIKVNSTAGKLEQIEVPLKDGTIAKVTRFVDKSLPGGHFQPDVGFSNPASSIWMPKLEDKPRDLSRAFVRQAVDGPQFERFIEAKGKLAGEFPVAVLPDDAQKAFDTKASTVYLSDATLTKQFSDTKHPELGLDAYRLLPDIIDFGEVWAQGDMRQVYLHEGDVTYRAVVKLTNDQTQLYLVSLFRERKPKPAKGWRKLR